MGICKSVYDPMYGGVLNYCYDSVYCELTDSLKTVDSGKHEFKIQYLAAICENEEHSYVRERMLRVTSETFRGGFQYDVPSSLAHATKRDMEILLKVLMLNGVIVPSKIYRKYLGMCQDY
jgi:hypothetical protein